MDEGEYERLTLQLALDGSADDGLEALRICEAALVRCATEPGARMPSHLARYLADRLAQILDDVPPNIALCIAKERGRRPDPIPDWQTELAALDLLLERQGVPTEKRNDELDVSRARTSESKNGVSRKEIYKIRQAHLPMRQLTADVLWELAGTRLRVLWPDLNPRSK